jgi:nicotinamide-nucleotide amidase
MDDASLDIAGGGLSALVAQVGAHLRARGWMLAAAESCTGGWVAAALTAMAGSSVWFERGFVTYSNEAKTEMLGVPRDLIERFGAVSEEVARAMALGAVRHSRAQIALSITGVAGPGGGTLTKPVGLVCFGWASGNVVQAVETKQFSGDRAAVRRAAVNHALQGVLAQLEKPV